MILRVSYGTQSDPHRAKEELVRPVDWTTVVSLGFAVFLNPWS